MTSYHSIEWRNGVVTMLDQRQLPHNTEYLDFTDYQSVTAAIKDMVIRGAPAIGAAAAYGLALTAYHTQSSDVTTLRVELATAANVLRTSRPTAVNLFWAINRMMARINDPTLDSVSALQQATLAEADAIAAEDVQVNRQIGLNALPLIPDKANIIHHCNTGSLATVDYGTALGIIRTAHEQGKTVRAYLDETRPRLQGAALSAWELKQLGVPHTVIVDGASGHLMRTVGIDLCVVGADRVVANGDTANKIGTYNLALAAHAHDVPFYVAAPASTIDMSIANGNEIKIEERPAREITHIGGIQITPDNTDVANPAFDITPSKYITAIITEVGIAYPPFEESLTELMSR